MALFSSCAVLQRRHAADAGAVAVEFPAARTDAVDDGDILWQAAFPGLDASCTQHSFKIEG